MTQEIMHLKIWSEKLLEEVESKSITINNINTKYSYYQHAIDDANQEIRDLNDEKKVLMSNLEQFIQEYEQIKLFQDKRKYLMLMREGCYNSPNNKKNGILQFSLQFFLNQLGIQQDLQKKLETVQSILSSLRI